MRDNKVAVGSVPYYGKIVDIIELNYSCRFSVVLFKCVWADTTTSRGHKTDHLGLISVNFSRSIYNGDQEDHEPYFLAEIEGPEQKSDSEVEKGLQMLLDSDPPALEIDFLELQKPNWHALNCVGKYTSWAFQQCIIVHTSPEI
ncbi:uncharacterized protein DS421_15g510640 [Arachis hypogaea]|nr:uncharacterized protein DS421_15g510640 [Arachis hypogaea]